MGRDVKNYTPLSSQWEGMLKTTHPSFKPMGRDVKNYTPLSSQWEGMLKTIHLFQANGKGC